MCVTGRLKKPGMVKQPITERYPGGSPGSSTDFLCFKLLRQDSLRVSQVAQWLRILLLMQKTWVQSLVWEDPLEKEMTTYASILARIIPWTEEPGGLQSMWLQLNITKQ